MERVIEGRTLLPVLLAVAVAGAVVYLATMGVGRASAGGQRESNQECASLSRSVANRAHSMLDGARFRATERQAYGVCVSDPAAFRRIVRGY